MTPIPGIAWAPGVPGITWVTDIAEVAEVLIDDLVVVKLTHVVALKAMHVARCADLADGSARHVVDESPTPEPSRTAIDPIQIVSHRTSIHAHTDSYLRSSPRLAVPRFQQSDSGFPEVAGPE